MQSLLALCLMQSQRRVKEVHFIVMNLSNVMFFNGYEYDDKLRVTKEFRLFHTVHIFLC